MKNRISVLTAVIVASVAVGFLAVTVLRQNVNSQKEETNKVTKLPEVVSKVDSLEITETKIAYANTESPAAAIAVKNNSQKPIIAITIESGDNKDASGTTFNSFSYNQPPGIICQPYEVCEVKMSLGMVLPGFPIRVSGVMYADGTGEGETGALNRIRAQKEHDENNIGGFRPQ